VKSRKPKESYESLGLHFPRGIRRSRDDKNQPARIINAIGRGGDSAGPVPRPAGSGLLSGGPSPGATFPTGRGADPKILYGDDQFCHSFPPYLV